MPALAERYRNPAATRSRGSRLRVNPRGFEEKKHDLLIWFAPGVDASVDAPLRTVPFRETGMYRNGDYLTVVTELDTQLLTPKNDRKALAFVSVPGHGLAWLEYHPSDQKVVALRDHFQSHRRSSVKSA